MQIGNYTARVLVDDDELEEHHVELVTPTRTTCWIAPEEGKTFSIEWHCNAETRTDGSVGWVTVDGAFCDGLPMFPGPVGAGDTQEMCSTDWDLAMKTHDFMFSFIQLSDEDHLLHEEVPEGSGEISLEIEHGKLKRVKGRRVKATSTRVPDRSDKVHETSKKAAHHRVVFRPKKVRRRHLPIYNLVVNNEPSLFFVFKFRPIAILRAHGLVPRPDASDQIPSPKPDQDRSRTPTQSNDPHGTELQKRTQNPKNKLKRPQDRNARLSGEPSPKKNKSEYSGRGRQSHTVPEIIDLTRD